MLSQLARQSPSSKLHFVIEFKQDYEGAIEDYDKCLQLKPCRLDKTSAPHEWHQMLAYEQRGDAKLELTDYQGAVADYNQSFQLFSAGKARGGLSSFSLYEAVGDLSKAYNKRGVAKDRLGDKAGACEDFRLACGLENAAACENSKKACNQK